LTYELDYEKFKDMLGDMLTEEDDTPLLESVQEYVIEDGCPTDDHNFLVAKVYEAYLIFLDLSKECYKKKINALQFGNSVGMEKEN
jgi:hypothetical protein